jgi:membrane protein implicated in regulation of membrane protease activity
MIIVWRGWGILVPVFVIAAFFVAAGVGALIPGNSPAEAAAMIPITGALAGVGIWLFQQQMDKRPKRAFVDEATGQRFEVGADAGSFFFIPTKFWAFIVPALGVIGLLLSLTGNLKT